VLKFLSLAQMLADFPGVGLCRKNGGDKERSGCFGFKPLVARLR
jgi:hypothetical protein